MSDAAANLAQTLASLAKLYGEIKLLKSTIRVTEQTALFWSEHLGATIYQCDGGFWEITQHQDTGRPLVKRLMADLDGLIKLPGIEEKYSRLCQEIQETEEGDRLLEEQLGELQKKYRVLELRAMQWKDSNKPVDQMTEEEILAEIESRNPL